MRQPVRLMLLVSLIHLYAAPAAHTSGAVIGRSPTLPFLQYWTLVDDHRPVVAVKGTIERLKLNTGPLDTGGNAIFDGDWNIYIRPVPEDAWALVNSRDDRNSNGLLEIEVKSPMDFAEQFRKGDTITAVGWWVEDNGHAARYADQPATPASFATGGGKTEIHPIKYIVKHGGAAVLDDAQLAWLTPGSTDDPAAIYAAQDTSNRFYVAALPIDATFLLRGSPTSADRNLHALGKRPVAVRQITERAKVDFKTALPGSASLPPVIRQSIVDAWNDNGSNVRSGRALNGLALFAHLPPLNVWSDPAYMATVSQRPVSNLDQRVTLTVEETDNYCGSDESGNPIWCKEAHFEVRMDLDAAVTFWQFQLANEEGQQVWAERQTNSLVYNLTYSPSEEIVHDQWSYRLLGFSQPLGQTPGRRSSIEQVAPITEERHFFLHEGRFFIEPSRIRVRKQALWTFKSCRTPTDPVGEITVQNGFLREIVVKEMPGASLVAKKWYVKLVRDSEGNFVNDDFHLISPDAESDPSSALAPPETTPRVFEEADIHLSPDANVLRITLPLIATQYDMVNTGWHNKTRILLRTVAHTDYGEELVEEEELFLPQIWFCDRESFAEDWEDQLVKGLIALRRLQQLGLLDGSDLPGHVPDRIRQEWPEAMSSALSELYKWEDKLPTKAWIAAKSYDALTRGMDIKPGAFDNLRAVIKLGRQLPDVKWIAPPSNPVDLSNVRGGVPLMPEFQGRSSDKEKPPNPRNSP